MKIQTRSGWRELAIKFTCARCGKVEYLSYDKAMTGEHYDYLHNSELPEGWKEDGGYGRILCGDCAEAFEKFMKG